MTKDHPDNHNTTNGVNIESANCKSTLGKQPLNVAKLALYGRHIIEASAGTGKTYNITRIVIRLLLERQVEIKSILIVTFTKAATQELKGRIAIEINSLLHCLEYSPEKIEPLFALFISNMDLSENKMLEPSSGSTDVAVTSDNEPELLEKLKYQQAKLLLRAASLSLDEASIFTIHSFCQRVLKQSAFMRQKSFSFDLINKSEPYYMQAIQDFFRKNANNKRVLTALEYLKIKTPNEFYSYFYTAFESTDELECLAYDADQNYDETKDTTLYLNQISDKFEALKQDEITKFSRLYQPELKLYNDFIKQHEPLFRKGINELATVKTLDKQVKDFNQAIDFFKLPSLDILPSKSALGNAFKQKNISFCLVNKADAKALIEALNGIQQGVAELSKAKKQLIEDEKQALEEVRVRLQTQHYLLMVKSISEIKNEASQAKQKREVIDHNDTIIELFDAIKSGNENVINYVRDSFPYALIDEFQDTDSLQYGIFSKCYPSLGKYLLLMIGDPKQAIYAFRGSDVNTYIHARDEADFLWSMQSNFRSSQSIIDAYNVLFFAKSINQFSLEEIISIHESGNYLSKQAISKTEKTEEQGLNQHNRHSSPSLFGELIDYPWIYKGKGKDVGTFTDNQKGAIGFHINTQSWSGSTGNNQYKDEQAMAVAHEIIRLTTEAEIDKQPVQPKDIAILVRGKTEASAIKNALDLCNIPNVYLSEKSNVFHSVEAKSIFYALDGILHVNDNRKFMRALSSDLFGLSVQELLLIQTNIDKFDELKQNFALLKQRWFKEGVLVMLTQLLKTNFETYRVDSTKERILTNYNHIAELLNEQSKVSEHAYQLLTWLKKQLPITGVELEESQETESEQRLESDNALVKIVTLHGSKGLEYPIVFIPYAGFSKPQKNQPVFKYYDTDRKINIISLGGSEKAKQLSQTQEAQEEMRLLYVGITRAIYKCYLGVGKPSSFSKSPLAKIIDCQSNEQSQALDTIETMANKAPDLFSVRVFDNSIVPISSVSTSSILEAQTSIFKGNTSQLWQLASFSYLAKQSSKHQASSFIDLSKKERDESAVTRPIDDAAEHTITHLDAKQDREIEYRFLIEKSADTGNLLHNLLEDHDFSQEFVIKDDDPHVRFYRHENRECNTSELQVWLNDVLSTPIPNIHDTNSFTLKNLNKTHVLKEPEFYFPIENCDSISLNELINRHRQSIRNAQHCAGNLVALDNVDNLKSELSISSLSGMMHGFIDLLFVFDGKYYVADYKSNYLGDKPSDYLGSTLRESIQSHLYDLQYLIYSWALDRYLQQRLQNYQRELHFGGVYYFFLRGMSSDYPLGNGIYSAQIVQTTWDLLDELLVPIAQGSH